MTNKLTLVLNFRVARVASERCPDVTVSCCRDGCEDLETEQKNPRQP